MRASEKVKLSRDEAVQTVIRLLEKVNSGGRIRLTTPEENAVMHDALCFSLYEFGVAIEDIPDKRARYSIDGNFKDEAVSEEPLRPLEKTDNDEWTAPDK